MVFAFLPPLCPGAGCSCAPRVVTPIPARAVGPAALSIGLTVSSWCTGCPRGPGPMRSPPVLVCLPRAASRLRSVSCPEAGTALAITIQVEPVWGGLAWIWLCGSTGRLVGGRENPGSAALRDAEPAPVRAQPAHGHPRCHAVTTVRLTPPPLSTQNHPNPTGSACQSHALCPGAPAQASPPRHWHGCAAFTRIPVAARVPRGSLLCRAGCGDGRQRLLRRLPRDRQQFSSSEEACEGLSESGKQI